MLNIVPHSKPVGTKMMLLRHPTVLGLFIGLAGMTTFAAGPAPGVVRLTDAQRQAAGLRTDAVLALNAAALSAAPTGGIQMQGRVVVPSGAISVVLSSVNGQLETLLVSPGQRVVPGTPLAHLYSGELLTLEGDFLNAAAQAEVQAARRIRDESLYKDGIIAQARLLETRAADVTAAAAHEKHRQLLLQAGMTEAAIAALKSPAQMSPRITIVARVRGVVLEQGVAVGGRVQSGDTLFRIGAESGLALELQAARTDAARLQVGDPVGVPSCSASGRITSIATQVDAATQTVLVRASISGTPGCLRANEYVQAAASPTREARGAVSVATAAIVRIGEQDHVFEQVADGYQARPVTVIQMKGASSWVVGAGLAPGAVVVTQGVAALKGQLQGLGPTAATGP